MWWQSHCATGTRQNDVVWWRWVAVRIVVLVLVVLVVVVVVAVCILVGIVGGSFTIDGRWRHNISHVKIMFFHRYAGNQLLGQR